jgi:hypothetical protein
VFSDECSCRWPRAGAPGERPGAGRTRPVRSGRRGRVDGRRGRGAPSGHADPAAGEDGAARSVAGKRPAARRGLGHPGRRGTGRQGQGVYPADRHVRLPGRPAGLGGDGHTPGRPGHHPLRAGRRGAGRQVRRGRAARRGVRLGLLDGPGTGHDRPNPALGASLHTEDAARALLAALTVPSGIYNVCRDGERVSHRRFTEATGGVHCARSVSSRPRRPRPRAAGGARGARRRTVRYSRPRSRPAPTTRRPAATG